MVCSIFACVQDWTGEGDRLYQPSLPAYTDMFLSMATHVFDAYPQRDKLLWPLYSQSSGLVIVELFYYSLGLSAQISVANVGTVSLDSYPNPIFIDLCFGYASRICRGRSGCTLFTAVFIRCAEDTTVATA